MEIAFRSFLLADPAVAGLVGSRVVWSVAPDTVSGRPVVVLDTVSAPIDYHMKAPIDLRQTLVQVGVWGDTHQDVYTLRDALIGRVSGARSSHGGVMFQGMFVQSQRAMQSETPKAAEQVFGWQLDVMINWKTE